MNTQKIMVLRSHRLWHESHSKEQRIEMTVRDLMAEMGCLLMCGWDARKVSHDGGIFEEKIHPESSVSPQIITFEVIA